MGSIASVVLSNATRGFDREYHYLIPENQMDFVKPGIRVIVPFGKSNKAVEAYVLKVVDSTEMGELKTIKTVIDEIPVLSSGMLELIGWMKHRYICTYSDVIRCMLPPGIGVKSSSIVRLERYEEVSGKGMKQILDVLAALGDECELTELKERVNSRSLAGNIKKLQESGLISIHEEYTSKVKEKTIRVAYLAVSREEAIDDIENNRIKRIQQIRILEMLIDTEYISVADIVRFAGVSAGVLDTLKKYGYIDYKDISVNRDPLAHRIISSTTPMDPTPQQSSLLAGLKGQLDKNAFDEILIHGVTGSGKTEVYLQFIQYCLDINKQAIVLVPEIALTPQMVERFKGRFGDDVAVLHSRLSLGERYDQWRLIRDGKIKVAVGARSAVFAPFERLGIIIIDEEHENSYKSEITPKYHARDVARERCIKDGAILLYGSATPSIDTYYRAMTSQIGLGEMRDRANKMVLPEVKLIDMRKELDEGNRSIFSRRLADEIEKNIAQKQQTILFLNRRGYSSFVLCRSCGYTMKCTNCNISLTYHAHDDRLICHYCGFTVKKPDTCPKCKSNYIKHFGTGTQKVEEEIRKQFTGCSVIRMDADTTSYKNSHEEILKNFREQNINIMVGTQMIAKGHDFPNVTLVGVLAADGMLNVGGYGSAERTFQLITQVAGRAGRGELPGRVVIQSYNTEDFSILAACKHDYVSFYNQEIKIRQTLNYPPFTNIAVMILGSVNDRLAFDRAKKIKSSIEEKFNEYGIEAEVYGPARAPLTKIKNKYRWRMIIKCRELEGIINVLGSASDEYYDKKEKVTVDLNLDINPVNML